MDKLDTPSYHSVDMNGVISLVNSQKGYFCIIQDFLKVLCDKKSCITQLLYIAITYILSHIRFQHD